MIPLRVDFGIDRGDVDARVDCRGLRVAVPDEPRDGFKEFVVGGEGGGGPHLDYGGAGGEGEVVEGGPGAAKHEGASAGAAPGPLD